MKLNEIMPGNWVFVNKNSPVQVSVTGECIEARLKYPGNSVMTRDASELDGIPVTYDILEANGFKRCGFADIYTWYDSDDEAYSITVDYQASECIVRGKDSKIEIRRVPFVHELQQAATLCKIEKEFKL